MLINIRANNVYNTIQTTASNRKAKKLTRSINERFMKVKEYQGHF